MTIAIFEAYGVKYDQLFDRSIARTKIAIFNITPTAHIHYIESVPKTKFFKTQQKIIVRND